MTKKIDMEVARSLYAQMCHFHDETEEHKQAAFKSTKKTAVLVKSIGTLLIIFVVLIVFYISELAQQFIQVVSSMDSMNNKVVEISSQMSSMKGNIAHMNDNVLQMNEVLLNMKNINSEVEGMSDKLNSVTKNVIQFNKFGTRAMTSMKSMNNKMNAINRSTWHMNQRMYEISRPAHYFPK